jgi:hypothetical protein
MHHDDKTCHGNCWFGQNVEPRRQTVSESSSTRIVRGHYEQIGQLFPTEGRGASVGRCEAVYGGQSRRSFGNCCRLEKSGARGAVFYAFADRFIDFIDGQ